MKYLILILMLPFLALSQTTITTVPSIAGLTNVYPSTTKPVVAVVSATGDKWLIYSYNASSVAATDDVYVVPTRTGVGRWLLTPWTGALTNIAVTGAASFETLEADVVDATRVLVPASIGMFGESEEHAAPLKYVRRLQVTVVADIAAQKAIETVDLGRLSFRNDNGQLYVYCPDLIIASDDVNYIRPDDVLNDSVEGRWQLYNPRRTGTATLVSGTVTVANTSVTANTRIFVNRFTDGGTVGDSYSVTRSAGVSFAITSKTDGSTQTSDTSVVAYQLIEP